ncbi:DegQ family serine endoprotease [Candidatus Endoriftia persephone]|jgi:serine protease Do|uniref:Probable periplasmic serine endoprotease DegP-like n=3 Tax=Gammaproteobacteria TaxID=1236 RepID=G2FE85_9GAMM|nr:DegQ family serine endoprotease [Candidatus Endoriftia persephone]EGV52433.1 serine protease precursor MucD/AlgY associated with sigma factor RpoE [endosymbiont of Riftia pachyptila (vent Ph05)]EGW54855.1 serine protease precursor MucD/AlgY associated with sigma factor RpoE [endosymbiont of Tevnia jerichonana (vent Tica)]USF89171.1 DegQ family serine endoprotease [Candidatus Endoriftia persephone]
MSFMQRTVSTVPFLLLVLLFTAPLQARSLPDFTELVEQNAPAVVNISTRQQQSIRRQMERFNIPDIPENSPFGELLRRFFGEHGFDLPDQEREQQSLGSGFIISPDGFILTNNHVVAGADEIIVRMNDRREFSARVIGSDERSDIALIKIEAEDLPVVKTGSAEKLKVGEWVLAIGTPFGFDHSVTAGIVSAKGRNLPSENYVPFIQTDVAINPGNSGGPLINLDGEVVGVNSQIYSRSGGFMGLSFAIPIEVAMNVAEQLKSKGRVSRGWLGVLIQDVTRDLAESFGMQHPQGALVARVLPGSPASKAGLQVGDVILSYNGTKLKSSSDLPPLVGASPIDRPVAVTVQRGGRTLEVMVQIGELPAEDAIELAETHAPKVMSNRLGLMVSDLSREQRSELAVPPYQGVMVDSVTGEAARVAGIQEGDVILMINERKVESVQQFNQLVAELPANKTVAVLVHRRSGPIFLALRMPAE